MKNWTLRKSTQKRVHLVALSTTASTQFLQQNPKALEAVWDYAYDRVGYLGTNTPIDRCYKCDFEGDFEPTERGFACPNCGNNDPKQLPRPLDFVEELDTHSSG